MAKKALSKTAASKKKAGGKTKVADKKRADGKAGKRISWLDTKAETPLIETYARQLGSFVQTMADGKVEESEIKAQEKRLVALMKETEPLLNNEQHEKVTRLLCELTAYDLMQMLYLMQEARPKTKFRG